ncbi:MAG: hypothetical protein A2176_02645 [Spirochaetes bacterium RBG_13_51_14]|nr:MAG: hypothetical protein A2176_02645 [Spirochaetes bacterium RBG_13_51_14]
MRMPSEERGDGHRFFTILVAVGSDLFVHPCTGAAFELPVQHMRASCPLANAGPAPGQPPATVVAQTLNHRVLSPIWRGGRDGIVIF